jgi:hypothetical protein
MQVSDKPVQMFWMIAVGRVAFRQRLATRVEGSDIDKTLRLIEG